MPRRNLRVAAAEPPRLEPWQVWLIDFDPQVGREQSGRRPGIVVGSKLACQNINGLALVVPCTTTLRNVPYQPRVSLARPSAALCDHVKSVSTQRLVTLLPDKLSADEIAAIKYGLRRMFA